MGEQIIIAITIIATVLIAGMTVNGIVEKVMQGKRLRHDARAEANPQAADIHEIAERTQMIEDRLRVLERIATDRGSLLSDEIEALRRDIPAIPLARRAGEKATQ